MDTKQIDKIKQIDKRLTDRTLADIMLTIIIGIVAYIFYLYLSGQIQ